jgi:trans-aconitate methyltransferase
MPTIKQTQHKDTETTAKNSLALIWAAEEYAHTSGMHFESVYTSLQKHDWNACDPFQRILDIGCGNGKVTAEIAARLPQSTLLGIDISPDKVAFCRQQYLPYYRNLSFEVMDILSLPERFTDHFDSITAFYCLHWVKDFALAMNEMHRCLKAGGQMIVYLYGKIPTLSDLIEQLEPQPPSFKHSGYYPVSVETIRTLAEENSFIIEYCEVTPYTYTYPDSNALLEWVISQPYLNHLPSEARLQCLTQAVSDYVTTLSPRATETITIHFPLIRCYAHKAPPLLARL